MNWYDSNVYIFDDVRAREAQRRKEYLDSLQVKPKETVVQGTPTAEALQKACLAAHGEAKRREFDRAELARVAASKVRLMKELPEAVGRGGQIIVDLLGLEPTSVEGVKQWMREAGFVISTNERMPRTMFNVTFCAK